MSLCPTIPILFVIPQCCRCCAVAVVVQRMIVSMQNFQISRRFVDDDDGRTFEVIVIVTAFPILFARPATIPKESDAIDDEQLAAVLLRWHIFDGVIVCCCCCV